MLVTSELLTQLWGEVAVERATSAEKSLIVFHSISEVDSVCATRLLMRFLDQNFWRPSYYPVSDFRDLRDSFRATLQDSTELRTVVMINCGATHHVKTLLEEDGINVQNVRFVVIDSHRPVDPLYNRDDDKDHLLFLDHDDPCGWDHIPAYSVLDELTEADYEELLAEADQSDDEEDGAGGGPSKRQKSHSEASPSSGGDDDDEGGSRRKQRELARERLRAIELRKAELDNYFTYGSCYGKPAALMMLTLLEQSNAMLSPSDLWPAIVGLTDQHAHQRTSSDHYKLWFCELREKLVTIAGKPEFYTDEDGVVRTLPNYLVKIEPTVDFRLMLHRHWTLYDAMQFSPYVAPRMQTWREGGLSRMAMVFVNMGLKLEQARVSFSTIAPPYNDLGKHLPNACKNTVLSPHDLCFDSFELKYGYSWAVGASDMVHALTGLMVRHSKIGGRGAGGAGGGGMAAAAGPGGDEALTPAEVRARQAETARDDFWDAVTALDVMKPSGMKLLREGIEEAKVLQRAVIKDGGLIITRRQLEANPAYHMQELNLQSIRPANSERFRHPLALLRLATFVRDAADVARTARKSKWPMAVVGPDDGSGYCCIVGIRHKPLPKQPQYNIFGQTFQQVLREEADTLKWDHERDGFDTAVVFVHKDSVPTFMTELKIRLGQQARTAAEAAEATARQQQQQQQQAAGDAEGQGGADADMEGQDMAEAGSPTASKLGGPGGVGMASQEEELDSQAQGDQRD